MESKSANIHIPAKHQSAPKAHPADKAIAQAAEEIASGNYRPGATATRDRAEVMEGLDIALRSGSAKEVQEDATARDFQATRESLQIGNHPRVVEAMAKLAQERDESRTSQEYVEKAEMLHLAMERQQSGNKWDGQERWIGGDNEEMRKGMILTPIAFWGRLIRVIGPNRVKLGARIHRTHFSAESGRVALLVPNEAKNMQRSILLLSQPKATDEYLQVGTLQWPCGTEWMIMRFNEYGIPTTPKYLGWRTALLSMIRLGVITEKEAHKAFPLTPGPASEWYRQQLFEMRSRSGSVN
jgi:hypothetical protein